MLTRAGIVDSFFLCVKTIVGHVVLEDVNRFYYWFEFNRVYALHVSLFIYPVSNDVWNLLLLTSSEFVIPFR